GAASAIDYSLKRWAALTRYLDDGRFPIDNNPIENAIRPIALGRKNSHDRSSSHRASMRRFASLGAKWSRHHGRQRPGYRDVFSTVAQTLIRGLDTPL